MKKVFLIITLIFCFEIVSAKELVKKYEDYLGYYDEYIILDDEGIYDFDEVRCQNSEVILKYALYGMDGKLLKTKEITVLNDIFDITLVDNKILTYREEYTDDDHYYVDIYNKDFEFIKTVETNRIDFSIDYYREYNDDYYMWKNLVFNRKTNDFVDTSNLSDDDKYGDKMFAGTYYPMYLRYSYLYDKLSVYGDKYYFGGFSFNNNYISISYLNLSTSKYSVAIINENFDIVLDLELDSDKGFSQVLLLNNSIYVSEYIIDEKSLKNEINDFYGYFRLKEFDYSGNLINTFDLFDVYYDSLFSDWLYSYIGRNITNIQIMNDEMVVISEFVQGGEWVERPSVDGLFVTGEKGTVHHYTFKYDITTKTDGNGSVEVVDKANYNDNIPFKVIPNDGYVVKDIKVTTKNGETVSFEDYKFIMPSYDVIIEVTFEKEVSNPVTSSFKLVFMLSVLIISFVILVILKNKRISFNK